VAPFKRGRSAAPALLCCIGLAAVPFKAVAALSAEETSLDVERVMETVVVTARRREDTVLDVPEAVSIVSQEEISRRAPQLVAEMLRGVPGAFFQQTTPGQGIPIIRGLKGSQVLHLVDGMRLNNAFFRNAPNQYLGLVDAFATSRAEVLRGSAPSLYGADAMGGVVQILTREPVFDSGDPVAEGRFYGSFNSADDGLVTRLEAAAGNDRGVLSGGVTYQDYGDRSVGGGQEVVPSAYRVKAADLKWRQAFGERSELTLSGQYLEQPATPRVDELVPGFGQDRPASEQYDFRPNRREFLHARYRLQSDSRWFEQLELHLARQVITDDRVTRDYGATATTREANESTLDGLTLQFNSPWDATGAGAAELVWGFEYYSDAIASSRRVEDDGGGGQPVRSRFPDGSGMDSAAVYAASQWAWERFSLDAGLRYSWFEITLPPTAALEAVRLTPSDLTGDLHLGYELTPELRLLANVGRGFRPPNIFDLGTLGSRPGNRFNVPNPALQPESVWSYDIGVKLSSGRWQAEAFAWYADYRDKIGSRLTGEQTPGGRDIVQSDNLNSVELFGIETGARYFTSDSLEFYAVLNYTRGEENDAGETVPADRIPPLNGKLGLVYLPHDRLRIEPYIDFAGKQGRLSPRDEGDPRIDPRGTPGWVTFNLLLSWQFADHLDGGLRLLNLGDRNYREHGSGIDAPGRSMGLWVDYRF
jgi:outer membrane receptor protein involved in Fe transport